MQYLPSTVGCRLQVHKCAIHDIWPAGSSASPELLEDEILAAVGLHPSSCTWSNIDISATALLPPQLTPVAPCLSAFPACLPCLPPLLLLPVHARCALVGIPCPRRSNAHLALVFSSVSTAIHLRPPCPGPANLPALQGNKTSRAANPKLFSRTRASVFILSFSPCSSDPRK